MRQDTLRALVEMHSLHTIVFDLVDLLYARAALAEHDRNSAGAARWRALAATLTQIEADLPSVEPRGTTH